MVFRRHFSSVERPELCSAHSNVVEQHQDPNLLEVGNEF